MTVHLDSIPTTNTLLVRLSLTSNGTIVATLDTGDSDSLSLILNRVMLVNPPYPPAVRNQQTPGDFEVHPGNIAFFENAAGGGINLVYATPGGPQTRINFS